MLFIQYNSQLCSKRLISDVKHLIINPPLQSGFNLAFCYQLSLSMIALLHTLYLLAGERVWKTKQGHPRVDEYYFTGRGDAWEATS